MSKFEEKVKEKIDSRAAIGLTKYGVTMERGDLGLLDWLKHLQEELMDAAVYVERLIEDFGCPIHADEKEDGCVYCRRL